MMTEADIPSEMMCYNEKLDEKMSNIQGAFKKRPNLCYKDFIAHFTAF